RRMEILHVDDEPGFANMTADFLEREDDRFTVSTATGTSEALGKLAENDFDCIISDYDMPEQNGIEFLKSIRANDSDLPFIIFTGKGSEEVASEAISAGADDYLQKGGGTEQYELLANRVRNAIEKREAQEKSQERGRRFDAVFQDPQMLVGVLDSNGILQNVNHTAMEYIETDREDVIGEIFWETPWWNDETRSDIKQWIERAATGEYVEFTEDLTDTDDNQYTVDGTIRPVTDEVGNIVSLIISARDITETKAKQQELSRYKAYLEQIRDIITVLDTEGVIQYETPSIKDVLGYEADERIGENAFNYIHPSDREEIKNLFEESLNNSKTAENVEFRARSKDGSWKWLEGRATYYVDEPINGIVASTRDISHRKQREQELKRYKTVLDTLPEGVSLYDSDLECIYVNQIITEQSGISKEEYLGSSLETILKYLPEDQANDWIEAMEAIAAGKQSRARATVRIQTDSDDIYYDTTAGRIESETGDLLGIVNVIRDITDHVKAKKELERQNGRLERFANVLSHDLRNPLNVAQGRLELAQEECNSKMSRCYIIEMERMEGLIDDVLALAQKGKPIDDVGKVALDDLLDRCWQNIETNDATLNIESENTIRADKSRVQQMIENLFVNAVKHGGSGVTITVGDLDQEGFYVADDGPGIPPSQRDSILDPGVSTAENSTGFGLSIVQEIVDAHDWSLTVTDSESGGARFEITGVKIIT
ncbi:MAG: PAS domain S-box protein, partial [Halobacteriaceae archaeon]